MNSSCVIDIGIFLFLNFMKGFEKYWLIKILGVNNVVIFLVIIFFSFFGFVFGMSEEILVFVIIIVLFVILMGYDFIIGLCMVYVVVYIGFFGVVLNFFMIGIV